MRLPRKTVAAAVCTWLGIAAAAPAFASTYVLDFSGPTTGPVSICTDNIAPTFATVDCASAGTFINQSYGDQPGVDVRYFTIDLGIDPNDGLGPIGQSLQYQNTNYPGLTAGFATYNTLSSISFVAQPGFSVGLGGLTLGWVNTNPNPNIFEQIMVFDLFDNSVLYDSGDVSVDLSTVLNFSATSTTGLQLQFLNLNGNFVAVDDIRYSATPVTPPPPPGPSVIPLPAAGWLLLAGIGALTLNARRRA